MVSILAETHCVKCTKTGCIAMCYGCEQSFCTKHFVKHRLSLSQQVDVLHEKCQVFQRDLNRTNFEHTLLSNIYAWERKSILKIQEIAEKVRSDVQQRIDQTKHDVRISLNRITSEFRSNNFTETDLEKWTRQLLELRNILEKPTGISIVEDNKSSSLISEIKLIQQEQDESCSTSIPSTNQKFIESSREQFRSIFGPCQLSDDNQVVTHTNYVAGLSQVTGINRYSSGKHAIQLFIEQKGRRNIFIGIHSSTKRTPSSSFDYSVHGWWNLDYVIINGESKGGENNEIIQTGDKITLMIDCDHRHIHLEHHRTKRLVHLPIELDQCPFPWRLLVRLHTAGDCVRIVK